MALVGEANGEPSGLQTSRMAVGAAANGEPRGFKYVIIYYLSKMETEMCHHSAFLSFSEEVVQQYGDDTLLCKSCVQRCNIFKTNGTQELNQRKHFLSHHNVDMHDTTSSL